MIILEDHQLRTRFQSGHDIFKDLLFMIASNRKDVKRRLTPMRLLSPQECLCLRLTSNLILEISLSLEEGLELLESGAI